MSLLVDLESCISLLDYVLSLEILIASGRLKTGREDLIVLGCTS